jgi:hypothetical protein
MMPITNDADTLARCLDDLEAGRTTLADCLARHPELTPALRAALAVRGLPPAVPSPAFRSASAQRMRNLIAAQPSTPAAPLAVGNERRRPWWQSLAAGQGVVWRLATLLVILSLVGGGTVLAAGESMPDQPLYGVKLAAEALQVELAPAAERRFDVYMQQSDRRLAEALAMALAGKYERALAAAAAYEGILREMSRVAAGAVARGKDVSPLVEAFHERAGRQRSVLQAAFTAAPPGARPALWRLLVVVSGAQDRLLLDLSRGSSPGVVVT